MTARWDDAGPTRPAAGGLPILAIALLAWAVLIAAGMWTFTAVIQPAYCALNTTDQRPSYCASEDTR